MFGSVASQSDIQSNALSPTPLLSHARYAPWPHALGGHQLGQRVRLRPGGARRGLGTHVRTRGRSWRGQQRVRGGGAGEGDPADAPGARRVHLRAGRPGEAAARPVRGVPGPRHRAGHEQRPLGAHRLGGAAEGRAHPSTRRWTRSR